MRKLAILPALLFLWLAIPSPAQAQLLENPKATQNGVPSPGFAVPPKAGTPTLLDEPPKQDTTALALQYYDRCMETTYPDISEPGRSDFCMCGATHARNVLTPEEMAFIATGKGAENIRYFNETAFNEKMDMSVSAPCLHYVIKERENEACLGNEKIRHFFVTQNAYDEMCLCMAGRMDVFINEVGPAMLLAARAREVHHTADPAQTMADWPDYQAELGRAAEECLNIYGHK